MPEFNIIGQKWFDKAWGNTYHSVTIYGPDNLYIEIEYQYGYDDQYLMTAFEYLKKHKHIGNASKFRNFIKRCTYRADYGLKKYLHKTTIVKKESRK